MLKFLFSKNNLFIILLCIFISLITIFSYSIIAISLMDYEINLFNLLFIFGTVTFISALPISYSGWGIRELSAIYLFKYFGYEQSIGLIAALLIGIISLITLFC